jgi:hypothetical protein
MFSTTCGIIFCSRVSKMVGESKYFVEVIYMEFWLYDEKECDEFFNMFFMTFSSMHSLENVSIH